jgi:hypothetical protein
MEADFRKMFSSSRKRGAADFSPRVCMVGCMGRIKELQLRKITQNYWSPVRSETGFVILSKFWSRYDFQNFRKRIFLGDDQGELS